MTVGTDAVGYLEWAGLDRGRIVHHKSALTERMLLWAARMLLGETDANRTAMAAVLWTMAQRFALLINRGNLTYPTYEALILAYSQPINPIWRDTGTAAQIARRHELATMTWASLEARRPGIKVFVYAWARGQVGNPVPGVAHFIQAGLERTPALYTYGGNAFLLDGSRLPTNFVTITAASSGSGVVPVLLAAAVAIIGGAFWWASREQSNAASTHVTAR